MENERLMSDYGKLELRRRALQAEQQIIEQKQQAIQARIFANGPVEVKLSDDPPPDDGPNIVKLAKQKVKPNGK